MWSSTRAKILHGIDTMLTTEPPVPSTSGGGGSSSSSSSNTSVYAELRGHPNDFQEDKGSVGYSPLLWGTSYENIVPAVIALSVIGSDETRALISQSSSGGGGGSSNNTGSNVAAATAAAAAKAASLGLDVERLDRTWAEYMRAGAFQWLNPTPELSAYILTTHVNSSGWLDPPAAVPPPGPPPPPPPPPQPTKCSPDSWLSGAKALQLGTGDDLCNPRVDDGSTSCHAVANAAGCCAACGSFQLRPSGNISLPFLSIATKSAPATDDGTKARHAATATATDADADSDANAETKSCGAWFFNGASTDCGGHGCCYIKSSATADKVTAPDPRFAAGVGPGRNGGGGGGDDGGICAYSGSFQDPPSRACPSPGGKTCPCASYAAIGKAIGWEIGTNVLASPGPTISIIQISIISIHKIFSISISISISIISISICICICIAAIIYLYC